MQAEDPYALRELLACSLALRPKHVDRKFLHRRRMRGKSIMSQQWFVSTDSWIAGTAADVQAAPAFFDIEVRLCYGSMYQPFVLYAMKSILISSRL